MSEERHVPGPPSELADTLNHWRDLFQRKHSEDFEALEGLTGMEDPIFSFLVDYADIDQDDLLSLRFNEYPEETIEQANEVLRSMCAEYTDVRCVLRPIYFPDEKIKTVSSLRMRNRGELVSLVVKIQDVGPRVGYLKKALYSCIACGHREEIAQRVARERKRPRGPCRICLEEAEQMLGGQVSYSLYKSLESLMQLTAEGSFYQDIQYLNVHDATETSKQPIQIILDDEYVDRHKPGQTIRINGVVYIDPIPDRNFVKDTRRILQVRALSIEEVS
jgi:DNA replicative helicase MCM subunit Mcm2 (Cdc46/Mcm family)